MIYIVFQVILKMFSTRGTLRKPEIVSKKCIFAHYFCDAIPNWQVCLCINVSMTMISPFSLLLCFLLFLYPRQINVPSQSFINCFTNQAMDNTYYKDPLSFRILTTVTFIVISIAINDTLSAISWRKKGALYCENVEADKIYLIPYYIISTCTAIIFGTC